MTTQTTATPTTDLYITTDLGTFTHELWAQLQRHDLVDQITIEETEDCDGERVYTSTRPVLYGWSLANPYRGTVQDDLAEVLDALERGDAEPEVIDDALNAHDSAQWARDYADALASDRAAMVEVEVGELLALAPECITVRVLADSMAKLTRGDREALLMHYPRQGWVADLLVGDEYEGDAVKFDSWDAVRSTIAWVAGSSEVCR